MTQFSMLPWTTGVSGDGAAPYPQEASNNFFRYFDVRNPAAEGVALGVLSELAVSGTSSPLTVAPGVAVSYGRYWNDSNVNLTVSTPTAGTTGGRVVLRCSWSSRQVRLAVKTSPNGIGSIPSLTQVFGNTWEISLATFLITTGGVITITDDRTFRKATFQVDEAALEDGAVTEAKLQNNAVTETKIADGSVPTDKLADYAVEPGKVGIAVPFFGMRVGTSGSGSWINTVAANNIAITERTLVQFGVLAVTIPDGQVHQTFTVTFPEAYLNTTAPLLFCQAVDTGQAGIADDSLVVVNSTGASNTSRTATVYVNPGLSAGSKFVRISWMAIGPSAVQP